MHELEIPKSVLAVGRAGAGTNNVPVAQMSRRGVPVFNAPGANANAVKELVLSGMFLAARNICQARGGRGLATGLRRAAQHLGGRPSHLISLTQPDKTAGTS
jgi:D-3-phosphoglycerate dehydrogenase